MKNETEETGAGKTARGKRSFGGKRSFSVENAEKVIYTHIMEKKKGKYVKRTFPSVFIRQGVERGSRSMMQ